MAYTTTANSVTPRKADTAARILRVAGQLLHREGIGGVAMRAVAEALDLTPMALYRYFPNRAALLHALAEDGFRKLAQRLAETSSDGDVEARLKEVADVFLDHALRFPHMYELMFLARREGARSYPKDFLAGRSPTFNPTLRVLEEAMSRGELRQDSALEIAFELSALLHGLLVLYRGGRVDMNAKQFRTLYQNSFRRYLNGLRA